MVVAVIVIFIVIFSMNGIKRDNIAMLVGAFKKLSKRR